MRTDKEQLDIIIERKSALEKRSRHQKKLFVSILSIVLCFAIAIGCVWHFSGTGEKPSFDIGGVESEKDPAGEPTNEDGVIEGENADDCIEDTILKEEILFTDSESYSSTILEGSGGTENRLQAGTLTCGEIVDNASFEEWLNSVKEKSWQGLGEKWKLSTQKRISVKGAPFSEVQLLAADGKLVTSAVSNCKGEAYLFIGVQESYKTVTMNINGAVESLDYHKSNSYNFGVQENGVATKLDLMFVIDTTGSMADELEYLKTEIGDVIGKIAENDINVRTSINFYRDEGDDYVVKYHGFKENTAQVQALVAKERADGGGDFPEAVHTALDNAVNGHAWDKDSVKVMFLVLDAPPHDDAKVIESLEKTIQTAAKLGIRIVPVASSGIDESTEFIMRSIALKTNGSYAFLTNHSGVGGNHLEPTTNVEYEIEHLNNALVRIALKHCGIEIEKKPISTQGQR